MLKKHHKLRCAKIEIAVIMVDNFRKAFDSIYEFKQSKTYQVISEIDYVDNHTNQLIETFPRPSEFAFENVYANYNGDKDACDSSYYSYFNNRAIPFPSNEQMVYDSGEDLKAKLKNVIVRIKFKR